MKQKTKVAACLSLALLSLGTLQACDSSQASNTAGVNPDPKVSPSPEPTPTGPPLPSQLYVGTEGLDKYLLKFIDDAKTQGIDVVPELTQPQLEIRVASLRSYGASVIGLCQTGSNTRRVTFDSSFWNSITETQREQLAHHEFGHCMLYRGHRTTVLASGVPASLMYPTIFGSSTYMNNYDYYQAELFGQALSSSQNALAVGDGSVDREVPTVHICEPGDAHSGDEPPSELNTTPPAVGV